MASENEEASTFNPRRRLCPDGSCIGIIGDDGRCTVCATSDPGAADSPLPAPHSVDTLDEPNIELPEVPLEEDAAAAEALPSDFNPNRRLCSDDACIGVIGEDNLCRLCGKTAAS